MNSTKLFEMYNSTFQPALAEGVYKVKMLSHEYVAKENKTPYIKFEFEVIATGRVLTENRFDQSFGIMVSHLRQQLGRENEAIQPIEFFNDLIKKGTEFNIWVVKRMVKGSPKTNFHFLKPIEEVAPNTDVVDDTVEEDTVVEENTVVEE
jgi:hypothetical protein